MESSRFLRLSHRVLVTCLLASILVFAPVGASDAASPTSISGWTRTKVTAAQAYALKSTIQVRSGISYRSRTWVLQRKRSAATTWSKASSGLTDSSGYATIRYRIPGTGSWQFRVVVPATKAYARGATRSRTVVGITGQTTALRAGWNASPYRQWLGSWCGGTCRISTLIRTGSSLKTRTATLYRKSVSSTTWRSVRTFTFTDGASSIDITSATGSWNYRFYVEATTTAGAFMSPIIRVTAAPKAATEVVDWASYQTFTGNTTRPVTIATGGSYVGRSFTLQRHDGFAGTYVWTDIGSYTTDSNGVGSVDLTGGSWLPNVYRIQVPESASGLDATSATVSVN